MWMSGTKHRKLAEGSANRFRLKLLLPDPGNAQAWIVPMGGLADLDFTCDGLATR